MEVIKNEKEKGRQFINKLSVGERQLAAAIRMYFLELDPLAVHTVSSAAHNVLADLMQERGKDASVHGGIYGIMRTAKKLQSGEITESDIQKKYGDGAQEEIKRFLELFEEDPDLDISQISSSAPPDHQRAYWSERRRAYNYIKHADRDAQVLLDEATINNEDAILQAIVCSQQLNMKHTPEKHFFYCAMISLGKLSGNKKTPMDLTLLLEGLSKEEVMALGRRYLCLGAHSDDECILTDFEDKSRERTRLMTEKLSNGTYEDILFFNFE